MSNLKKYSGYSIGAASAFAALALMGDRYAEFAVGAESLASWALPPLVLFAMAASAVVVTKLGHPDEGETHA